MTTSMTMTTTRTLQAMVPTTRPRTTNNEVTNSNNNNCIVRVMTTMMLQASGQQLAGAGTVALVSFL